MKTKTFLLVLSLLVALCVILTIAHFVYAAYAYEHASIIQFIAKELW